MQNKEKEQMFTFPVQPSIWFGRSINADRVGSLTVSAVPFFTQDNCGIILSSFTDGQSRKSHIVRNGSCYEAKLSHNYKNEAFLIWNEFFEPFWKIHLGIVDLVTMTLNRVSDISQSNSVLMTPAFLHFEDTVWIAYSEQTESVNRIRLKSYSDDKVKDHGFISSGTLQAQRPAFCEKDGVPYIVWDQYSRNYGIEFGTIKNGTYEHLETYEHKNERWMAPRVACSADGIITLVWTALKHVMDSLGVIDNAPFIMARTWDGGISSSIISKNLQKEEAFIDLRDGLLPFYKSKGYVGRRRNPQLGFMGDELFCIWETRPEAENTSVEGHLVCRRIHPFDETETQIELHQGGYSYAAARTCKPDSISFAFFRFENEGIDLLCSAETSLPVSKATDINANHSCRISYWDRWQNCTIDHLKNHNPKSHFAVDNFSMYWADTHCHCNLSADAEGEIDEQIHYARDIAGLDVLCLIDNDYYPRKAISAADWSIKEEYAELYTVSGEFVVFPGYEYTFHRNDIDPSFNHRCIIYPQKGGKLVRRIDKGIGCEEDLYRALSGQNFMSYPHHCSYKLIDPRYEWNVEVCSSWRVCIEECDFTIKMLNDGHIFGFIGSSDTHRCIPGHGGALTGIYARDLTPESLFEAYRERRLIATQGFFINVDFKINNMPIGSILKGIEKPELSCRIESPDKIEYVEILSDGICLERFYPGSDKFEFSYIDNRSWRPSIRYYFLRIKLEGDSSYSEDPRKNSLVPFTIQSRYPHNIARARGVFAWTSPIWVSGVE